MSLRPAASQFTHSQATQLPKVAAIPTHRRTERKSTEPTKSGVGPYVILTLSRKYYTSGKKPLSNKFILLAAIEPSTQASPPRPPEKLLDTGFAAFAARYRLSSHIASESHPSSGKLTQSLLTTFHRTRFHSVSTNASASQRPSRAPAWPG